MICEYAYYRNGEDKPYCNNKHKIKEDDKFKDKCPLIYWCPMSKRYENTGQALDCVYRNEVEKWK